MANIALDAGKVVLKDGKASCACCVCPTCQVDISQNTSFLQTLQNATGVSIDLQPTEYSNYSFTQTPSGDFEASFNNYEGIVEAIITFSNSCKQVYVYIGLIDSYGVSFTYQNASCPYEPTIDVDGILYFQQPGADCYVNGISFPILRTYSSDYPPPSINFTVF